MTPEPRLVETPIAKKERRAVEAKAAWADHKAHQLAVDKNMARLRELRLAQETLTAAPAVKPRVVPRKRAKSSVKIPN
jgi:hypothetical protein